MAKSQYVDIGYNIQIIGEDAGELYDFVSELEDVMTVNYKIGCSAYFVRENNEGEGNEYHNMYVYTMDDEYYEAYLKAEGILYDEDTVILLDEVMVTISEDKLKLDHYVESADSVRVVYEDLVDAEEFALTFVRPDHYPMGFVSQSDMGVILSQTQFEDLVAEDAAIEYMGIFMEAEDSYGVEQAIWE